MTLWQWINNNFPPYAEEIIINQEIEQVQETLSKFQQPIPNDFIQVETDYIFTTKSKWSKPLSERYSFEYEGEWFQIDISHSIMESLELEKGEEITQPFHLDPKVLKRKPACGGITIEKEEEIFLERPFAIKNLEKDINELIDKIKKLEKEKENQEKKITQKDGEINNLKNKIRELEDELAEEKGWWNKWINDDYPLLEEINKFIVVNYNRTRHHGVVYSFNNGLYSSNYYKEIKKGIKSITYEYYKNK